MCIEDRGEEEGERERERAGEREREREGERERERGRESEYTDLPLPKNRGGASARDS